jgi:hypothetical protein
VEILVNLYSNYAQCIGYNRTYAFHWFLAHISLKIKAKAAKMQRFYSKTYASVKKEKVNVFCRTSGTAY